MTEVMEFFRGRKGNIISKLPDGRIALVNKNAPVCPREGEKWLCEIDFEKERFAVVTPVTRIVKKRAMKYLKFTCGHIEPLYEVEVEVPEDKEPEQIIEPVNCLCHSCSEKAQKKLQEYIGGVRKDLKRIVGSRAKRFLPEINPIIKKIDDLQCRLNVLDKEYREWAKQKKAYMENWLRNAKHTVFKDILKRSRDDKSDEPDIPDDEWWIPAYERGSLKGPEALTLEWDGIRISYYPFGNNVKEEIRYKLAQALEETDLPFIVKMRELEEKLSEIREEIRKLYSRAFEMLISDPVIKAFYSLLAEYDVDELLKDEAMKPLIPVFERWLDIAQDEEYVRDEITCLEDLLRKVRNSYLYEIDMYDGCFGSICNVDCEREFTWLVLSMVE